MLIDELHPVLTFASLMQLGLPKQLYAALESRAAAEGKSASQVAREALQAVGL